MEFSRQEYWSGLPSPPEDLPDPGIEPCLLSWQVGSLPLAPPGNWPHNSQLVNKHTTVYDSHLTTRIDPCFLEFNPCGILSPCVCTGPFLTNKIYQSDGCYSIKVTRDCDFHLCSSLSLWLFSFAWVQNVSCHAVRSHKKRPCGKELGINSKDKVLSL